MHSKTIAELANGLKNREYSSEELTRTFLERIQNLDGELNSFITVAEEHALKQAKDADQLFAAGKGNYLTGIPLAQKDIFCTNGINDLCFKDAG